MTKWEHLSDDDIHPPSGRTMGAKRRAWRKYNAKKPDSYLKEYYQNNKYRWEKKRYARYGITEEQYNTMLDNQDHSCIICKKHKDDCGKKGLNIDHCHDTGKVRGLLCGPCNTALGLLKEDADTIERLREYAASHS